MFGDGALTFQEFVMKEPHPLAQIHDAVLEFLRGRSDAVMVGAQAVNAYAEPSRMTQDVDLVSTRAEPLAEEIRAYLADRFHIATRVRSVAEGRGFRVFQLQKPKNRHLVDVRQEKTLPPARRIEGVLVPEPAELIASKVVAYAQRMGKPKSWTDRRDLAVLLLAFPALKSESGAVNERLHQMTDDARVFDVWKEIVHAELLPEDDDSY
ncbi:hypothetical protein HY256_00965 [Candidatus Sumerlaeota bacterium]|nr:hypothetical protein [Candidatus Sumerlaeota bacterium]